MPGAGGTRRSYRCGYPLWVIHQPALEANHFVRTALLEDGGGVLCGKLQPAEHHAHQNYPDLG